MRIINAELRKVLTRQFFLILLVAIVANFLLFRKDLHNEYIIYNQQAFVSAQNDVLQLDETERLDHLLERKEMLRVCQEWEIYDSLVQSGYADSRLIDEEMRQYQEVYESGTYLKYTESLLSELYLINDLLNAVREAAMYQETLDDAIQEAVTKTTVSIFAKPGTFSYRSQLATIDRLERLKHISPTYDVSAGILNFQDSAVTDLIALLMILLLCTQMVVTEQNNGMLPILRTTRYGRSHLILSKVITTFVLALVVSVTLWGANLAYCSEIFGLGDLSRPIQSLSGYNVCVLEMSVGQYLVFFLFLKWVLYSLIGLACLLMGSVLRNAMLTWLTVGGSLGIEYILAKNISPISAWNILKYVNAGNLIFEIDWLAEYRNLNFFGFPVDVFTASYMQIVLFLLTVIATLFWVFCSKRVQAVPVLKLHIQWPGFLPRPGKSTSLINHENWKLLIECGVLVVLVLFLFLNVQEPRIQSNSIEELYYKSYMQTLAGPLTPEKEAYLESESLRFQNLRSQIVQIQKDYADGLISEDALSALITPLNRALEAEEVFVEKILPQRDRLLELQAVGKDGWFVHEKGYYYLLGLEEHEKTGSAALVVAACILCFSNFYPLEVTSGMIPILNVYQNGRRKTASVKICLCMLYTLLLFLIAQIPDYWYVSRNFGFSELSAPLCSVDAFTNWWDVVPIWGGIALFEGSRLMTCLALSLMILFLSMVVRNQVITLSISGGVILMPILLHMLDITLLDGISFYQPLTGTDLLCYQMSAEKYLLYYGLIATMGTIITVMALIYAGEGYRMKRGPKEPKA